MKVLSPTSSLPARGSGNRGVPTGNLFERQRGLNKGIPQDWEKQKLHSRMVHACKVMLTLGLRGKQTNKQWYHKRVG